MPHPGQLNSRGMNNPGPGGGEARCTPRRSTGPGDLAPEAWLTRGPGEGAPDEVERCDPRVSQGGHEPDALPSDSSSPFQYERSRNQPRHATGMPGW